jgi:hypothetical protein
MEHSTIADWHQNKDDIVYVCGEEALLPNVLVQTTDKSIKKCLQMAKENPVPAYQQATKDIKNADVDALYNAGGMAWQGFMDAIIVYYACRYHIFGLPIPIIDPDAKFKEEVKSIHSERGVIPVFPIDLTKCE